MAPRIPEDIRKLVGGEHAEQDERFKRIRRRQILGSALEAAGEAWTAAGDPDGDDRWAAGIGIGLSKAGRDLSTSANRLDEIRLGQSLERSAGLQKQGQQVALSLSELDEASRREKAAAASQNIFTQPQPMAWTRLMRHFASMPIAQQFRILAGLFDRGRR